MKDLSAVIPLANSAHTLIGLHLLIGNISISCAVCMGQHLIKFCLHRLKKRDREYTSTESEVDETARNASSSR